VGAGIRPSLSDARTIDIVGSLIERVITICILATVDIRNGNEYLSFNRRKARERFAPFFELTGSASDLPTTMVHPVF
jgi:hypothetical protein